MTVSKAKEICNGGTNPSTDRFSSKARYLKMKSMLNSIFKIGDFAISHN